MLKNLILGLVLSTSAAASAAPCNDASAASGPSASRPVHVEPAYEVARTQPAYPVYQAPAPIAVQVTPAAVQYTQPAPARSWVNLSGGLKLSGTTNVYVGKKKGEFRAIELVSGWGNGTTKIGDVTITFGNGQTQTVCLDQVLGPKNRTASIDLAGNERFIKSITVSGNSRGRSQIEIRAI